MKLAASRLWLACLLCFFLQCAASAEPTSKTAVVVLPKDAAAPLNFAADTLREALAKKGFQVKVATGKSSADFEVMVTQGRAAGDKYQKAPDKPESYAVSISSNKRTAYVDGSDATGAMYGEFEFSGANWRCSGELTGPPASSRTASRLTSKSAA